MEKNAKSLSLLKKEVLDEIEIAKENKIASIKAQKYEDAAVYRMEERNLIDKHNSLLEKGKEIEALFKAKLADRFKTPPCVKKVFNFSIENLQDNTRKELDIIVDYLYEYEPFIKDYKIESNVDESTMSPQILLFITTVDEFGLMNYPILEKFLET